MQPQRVKWSIPGVTAEQSSVPRAQKQHRRESWDSRQEITCKLTTSETPPPSGKNCRWDYLSGTMNYASNSEPQAVTSVNKEFCVFLQTENIDLLEVTRRSVTFSQKSNVCSTCTWRRMMGSSLLMPGGACGHIFSQPRNMYKAASCEIFREKKIVFFSFLLLEHDSQSTENWRYMKPDIMVQK